MPIHDWTRVDAGLFHDFHQPWTVALRNALNSSGLPPEYFALVEQHIRGPIPDVLTLKLATPADEPANGTAGVAVAQAPPRTRLVRRSEADIYTERANIVTVRHRHGDVVAVIEIISPGNKASRAELRALVQKSADLIRQGVHLLILDLFPPGVRDPHGLHKAIWDKFEDEDFAMPVDKPLLAVSYDAGPPHVAYVEPMAVGGPLPDMPLFLQPGVYVPAPLASSYETAWQSFPAPVKRLLEE